MTEKLNKQAIFFNHIRKLTLSKDWITRPAHLHNLVITRVITRYSYKKESSLHGLEPLFEPTCIPSTAYSTTPNITYFSDIFMWTLNQID